MAKFNVKVPVDSVLTALRKKLVEIDEEKVKYEEAKVAHEIATAAWREQVKGLVKIDYPKNVEVNEPTYWRPGSVTFTYEFPKDVSLPAAPEMPDVEWYIKSGQDPRVAEIKNAIRILEMTDEKHVSASTFKTISTYL